MEPGVTLEAPCAHLPEFLASPRAEACERCGEPRNLRACAECGHVGCCESLGSHDTAHFRESDHPVIRQMPIGEGSFTWCYVCERYL